MASSSEIDVIQNVLDFVENGQSVEMAPLKVQVQTLGLKLKFLFVIARDERKKQNELVNWKALRNLLPCDFFFNEYMEFFQLWSVFEIIKSTGDWCWPMNLAGVIHGMVERLELLNPVIQQIYTILSKSSRCKVEMMEESVIILLNTLLHDIENLLRCKADFVNPFEEELEAVQKGMGFLRNFLGFASLRSKFGKLKDLVLHAEIVAHDIACLLYLCCDSNKLDDQMIRWVKLELLYQVKKIKPTQAEVRKIYVNALKSLNSSNNTAEFVLDFLDSQRDLLGLLENSPDFDVSITDQMSALHEELRFLECLVVDSPSQKTFDPHVQKKLEDLIDLGNILIKEAAFITFSFYNDENDDESCQTKFLVLDFLAKIKTAKEEARQLYEWFVPKALRSNFPVTNAQGFITSFMGNLKQLLSSKDNSVAPLKDHINAVLEELYSLKGDLCKITSQPIEQEELECHWTRLKDAAYQTEHIIDFYLAIQGNVWFIKLGLFEVVEEIKETKAGLRHLRRNVTNESKMLQNLSSVPDQISVKTSAKDELVIFQSEFEEIMVQMSNGSEKLNILSIVGMPGIGKTTLANSIYQHDSLSYHFHVRASCCVSKSYDSRRLLLEILKQVNNHALEYGDEDLDHKLCQSLKGRRYLIFLDDIWDSELLNDMRHTFPDDRNGSRIMITSRLDNIASQAGGENIAYYLSPISVDKSWELFKSKVFGKEGCPEELVELGQEIATSCRGLPLAIDLIAGLLRQLDRKKDSWLEIGQAILREEASEPLKRSLEVLAISYNNLPCHLRPCFLYFGGFPEDMFIPAKRLKLIWIAEGFIELPENDGRDLEDVAQMYLDQLISRSLVLVTVRGSLGGVKLAQIHDLLHGFAVAEAAKEGFLSTIDRYSDFLSFSSLGYPWSLQYRLCIYPSMTKEFIFSQPSGHRVRSLLFPKDLERTPDLEVFHSTIDLSNFLVLRVIELPDINIKQVRPSLLQLIHLRFLAIRTCERDIFSDILYRLRSLETLILMLGIEGGLELSLSDIDNIARLRFLRHFEVCGFTFPRISQDGLEKMNEVPFHNLQYLSSPILCSGKNQQKKFMQQMSNLRKLKCLSNQNHFLNLNFLSNLESLSITGLLVREHHTTTILHFPPYLKKLTFRFLRLPWTTISIVGKLKHLQVLKFQFIMFSTDVWDMVECNQQFPKLQYLQLFGAVIKVWNASVENLPLLERLNVTACSALEELPSCLADIPTLQEVILSGYCDSLAISADEIKEQQVEQGNEKLRVQKIPSDPADDPEKHREFPLTMTNAITNLFKNFHEFLRTTLRGETVADKKLLESPAKST